MIEVGQLTDRLSSIKELLTFPTSALEVIRLASDPESNAAEVVDDETLKNFIKDAIKLLPSTERLVLTLKLYERLDLQQVAVVLGYEEAKIAESYRSAISTLQRMAERAILTNRLDGWEMRF